MTGEVLLKEGATLAEISEAFRTIKVQKKEFEAMEKEVKELIQPHIEKAVENGEDKLMNYWTIVRGARRFNKAHFLKAATKKDIKEYDKLKPQIEDIEDKYKVHGSPFLKFPKLS